MKGLASLEQREQLKGRSIIETAFSVLKLYWGQVIQGRVEWSANGLSSIWDPNSRASQYMFG